MYLKLWNFLRPHYSFLDGYDLSVKISIVMFIWKVIWIVFVNDKVILNIIIFPTLRSWKVLFLITFDEAYFSLFLISYIYIYFLYLFDSYVSLGSGASGQSYLRCFLQVFSAFWWRSSQLTREQVIWDKFFGICIITLSNVCAAMWRVLFTVDGYHQHYNGIPSMLWRVFSTVGDYCKGFSVKYTIWYGYHQYQILSFNI